MKKPLLIVVLIMIGLPSALIAKNKKLVALKIQKVYLYSGLIHKDDAIGQRETYLVKQTLEKAFGWTVTNSTKGIQAEIVEFPHGADYQNATSSSCTSVDGILTCHANDGSTFSVMCTHGACSSQSNSGNYMSLLVAAKVGTGTHKPVETIWNSNGGFSGMVNRMNVGDTDDFTDQAMAVRGALFGLCKAAGIGGSGKCDHLISHAWKSINNTEGSTPAHTTAKQTTEQTAKPTTQQTTHDFRKADWGMNPAQVEATESGKPDQKGYSNGEYMVVYTRDIAGFSNTQVLYTFAENKLVEAAYFFNEQHSNPNEFISDFKTVRNLLTQKYGTSPESGPVWDSDAAKGAYDGIQGMAVVDGYLQYKSYWYTPKTHINEVLYGDNGKVTLMVVYYSVAFHKLDEAATQKANPNPF